MRESTIKVTHQKQNLRWWWTLLLFNWLEFSTHNKNHLLHFTSSLSSILSNRIDSKHLNYHHTTIGQQTQIETDFSVQARSVIRLFRNHTLTESTSQTGLSCKVSSMCTWPSAIKVVPYVNLHMHVDSKEQSAMLPAVHLCRRDLPFVYLKIAVCVLIKNTRDQPVW